MKKKSGPTISPHARGGFYTTYKKKFIYGSTEEEVMEKYITVRYKSGQGYNVTDNPTVEEYAIRWFNLYKRNKRSLKTQEMYVNAINVHIVTAIGKMKIKDVVASDIQAILNAANTSHSLQHQVRITLKQIFKKAQADRLIALNPVMGTEPVDAPLPVRRFYTPEQRTILIDLLNGHKSFPLIFGILNTGIRATEAIALMRSRDLDLNNGKLYVVESTEFKKSQPKKKPTKTKRGVREIPLPSTFTAWLKEHLSRTKSLYVFPGHHGSQMGQSELKNTQRRISERLARWFDVAEAAQKKERDRKLLSEEERGLLIYINSSLKIENIADHRFRLYFKALRHTYCTELFDLGVDEVSAAAIMGHSVSVMREIYTHIQKERKIQTEIKIEGLYSGRVHRLPEGGEGRG